MKETLCVSLCYSSAVLKLIYAKNGTAHSKISNFVCMFGSLSMSLPVWAIMCVFACGWVRWADVCTCEWAEEEEPQPGAGLRRALTQTVTKYCRDLEIEETLKLERAKEREINEREGGQLPVCVSASPRSDWELQATLSGLSLHTRRCHISLTGQQASLPLSPSLTSMWIITQCR